MKGLINIAGASGNCSAPIISEILENRKGQCLIVVPTLKRAKKLQTDLSFFNGLKLRTADCDNKQQSGLSNVELRTEPFGENVSAGLCVEPIYVLSEEDRSQVAYDTKNNDSLIERARILKAFSCGESCIVIATAAAALEKLPPENTFEDSIVELKTGKDIDITDLSGRLNTMGYERVEMVETCGEYSIRGGIIDIFAPGSDRPCRIELFDTEIDSIRTFNQETQRSVENIGSIAVCQCCRVQRNRELFLKAAKKIRKTYDKSIKRAPDDIKEELTRRSNRLVECAESMINVGYLENMLGYFYEDTSFLWEYMKSPVVIIDDPSRILESLETYESERTLDIENMIDSGKAVKEDFLSEVNPLDYFKLYEISEIADAQTYILTPFVMTIKGRNGATDSPSLSELRQVQIRQVNEYDGRIDRFVSDAENYISRGYEVNVVCGTKERAGNMLELIQHEGFNSRVLPGGKTAGHVSVIEGTITGGIELTDKHICYIWEGDVFGGNRKSRRKKQKSDNASMIKSFADVKTGDFVVHESHGIGKFTGVKQLVVQGIKQDFLRVEYAGTDMLYIPVDQLSSLQKYIGGDGITPKLHKLSGNEWKAVKARAQAAVSDMAEELIRVANARRSKDGFAFAEDTVWQKEFEESFPYTETEDQLKCIQEIKEDMEKPYPMDRLLCGDVGFGKTEVAARALFKCVIEGKQAAILAPTTLLANQHYYTLKDRFEKFPIRVEMLSRFRNRGQQAKIVGSISRGEIDLIIGTHRLLSKDVKFRDLGLLVIDEEQKFGVKHKEKIKQLRENIDVLTLSATPIPRTLHMSLSGMKDMSTIEEPPEDRYPVQTYVMEEDKFTIREAIEKEIGRDGQVYVLYNRVQSIERVASEIGKLVPDASIAVGHGQMSESQLEDVVMAFAGGEYDVLVSTTIIESGTDIPNVNTMIVLDADRFGLAQLYQLRGRVGRSGRMAYAYLMYKRDKVLTEIAEKRLKAIRDFTEFGSGFKIAMRDLELRGAGSLLGREQSGHMLEIGYELYCKLLDEALHKEKQKQDNVFSRTSKGGDGTVGADESRSGSYAVSTAINLPVSAIIPDAYINDEALKLQMYKKAALISCTEEASDVMDEFLDRFGDPPEETINLIKISVIRSSAGRLGITDISHQGRRVKFTFIPEVRFEAETIPNLLSVYGDRIKFSGGRNPSIYLTTDFELKGNAKIGNRKYTMGILKEVRMFLTNLSGDSLLEMQNPGETFM